MPPQQQLDNKYILLEEVGHGGMAVVYRAKDTLLDREVAVKILHAHLAEEEEARQRFHREAQAVAKLHHRNILEIYDYSGLESDESFIVTEFIRGRTLRDYLRRNPISHPELAVMIILEVCKALAHAHGLGVIHRDIKPENIMIRRDGLVKLTDFGIAQVVDVQRLTVTGQLLGSPAYMPPELVEGKRIDARSDLFSVGTLLYQLATSELPFVGKNPHELLKRISEGVFTDPEVVNPIVGAKLSRIIKKALAHDPDARYLDIASLQEDLRGFLADVDIEDSRGELAEYFQDPKAYSQALQTRVVEALTRRGQDAQTNKQVAAALQYFNRVLCCDPANPEVLAVLNSISRRQQIFRGAGLVVLALALLAGGYMLTVYWPWEGISVPFWGGRGPADSGTDSVEAGPPDSFAPAPDRLAAVDLAAADLAPDLAAPRADRRRAVRRPPPPPPAPRRVEIIPVPKAVSIWLNGERLGDYGPDLRFVELPGDRPSVLAVRNDACCFEWKTTLSPDKPLGGPIRPKLAWKPAQLVVTVEPTVPSDIVVNNQVYRAGQAIPVPIPSYSTNGRAEVEAKVSADGYMPRTVRVKVTANRPTRHKVTLRRSP